MSATGGLVRRLSSVFCLLASLAITGCTGGSGGNSPSLLELSETAGTESTVHIAPALGGNFDVGSRIGEFELSAPLGDPSQGNSFLIRGTMPVPQGAFPPGQASVWLGVADYDGNIAPAQLERVTRYPNGDGAVFEILSRVRRDPTKTPGTRVVYPVYLLSDPTGASFQTAGPTQSVPTEIAELAAGARKILVRATDVFGNRYDSAPLGTAHRKTLREGPFVTTLRSYQTLKPHPPTEGSQGTLSELLGVHSYITQQSGEKVLTLDLRLHNGMVGPDPAQQNPVRPVYFQSVQICVPSGFTALNTFPDPYWDPVGRPVSIHGKDYTAFDLIKPMANGQMHVFDKQAQTHRRLAITVAGNESRAQAVLDFEGLAFNRAGTDPASGQPLWSWWNPQTANFMQGNPLPHLQHWGAATLRSYLAGKFQQDRQVFENGQITGVYPWHVAGGPGGGQSAGVQYGGMTGGTEIQMNNGIEAAFAGSREAALHAALLNQANANRQSWALYNPDGSPISAEQIVQSNAGGAYCLPFKFFQLPEGNNALHYFQLNAAPTFHEAYVASHNLQPSYENDHFGFDPHDYQHLIRYTRHLFALLFLANDALAKEDLEATANHGRLAQPEFPLCGGSVTGLLGAYQGASSNPGKANGYFGRGQGWLAHAVSLYYAAADDAWRAQNRPWLDRTVDTAEKAQVPCTGVLLCSVNNKFSNPNLRMRQHFEQMIWNNALQSMIRNVYEGTGSVRENVLRHVLQESAYSFIRPVAWSDQNGPWKFLAVSDLNPNTAPTYCTLPLPPNSAAGVDNYMIWDSFAYGFRLSGDPIFVSKAMEISNGNLGGLKSNLEKINYQSNLGNNAALLRLMQELQWTQP